MRNKSIGLDFVVGLHFTDQLRPAYMLQALLLGRISHACAARATQPHMFGKFTLHTQRYVTSSSSKHDSWNYFISFYYRMLNKWSSEQGLEGEAESGITG